MTPYCFYTVAGQLLMKIGSRRCVGEFCGQNWPHRLHHREPRDKNRKGEIQSLVPDVTHHEAHTNRKMRSDRGL